MKTKKFDFTTLKNIGAKTAKTLEKLGVRDFEDLKKLGAEKLFFKYFENSGGWKAGMCSCWLYAIEGAITGVDWWKIPESKKSRFKKFVKDLRASFDPRTK